MRKLILSVTAALAFAGCGDGADKTAPFVGAWTVTMGTTVATCPPPINTVTLPADRAEQSFVKGTDADLVMTPLANCMLKLDVEGRVATMRPNQMCNITVMSLAVAATVTSGNFT